MDPGFIDGYETVQKLLCELLEPETFKRFSFCSTMNKRAKSFSFIIFQLKCSRASLKSETIPSCASNMTAEIHM